MAATGLTRRERRSPLEALGVNVDSDLERFRGRRVVDSLPDA